MDLWSHSFNRDDELEKLAIRMNPPRVTVDNSSSSKATIIKVDSANKSECLLEVAQVFIDMNLIVNKAYISSDGKWFMAVFHVTDQNANKLRGDDVAELIRQSLGPRSQSFRFLMRSVGVHAAAEHTAIELTGRDRPGLLSEIFAILTDLKYNMVAAEVWTHNSRMASVIHVTDEASRLPIDNPDRISNTKKLLMYVLKGVRDKQSANTAVSMSSTHKERRLHQMMYADRDYDVDNMDCESKSERSHPLVTVENCTEKGYTVVTVRCIDRPKLLFDTVCTLTDMQYVVYHGTNIAEGSDAFQEYYIRHVDGFPITLEAEKQRLINCLEAAIKRRTSEGIRLELCGEDRVGLLSDVTRIFRENGISLTRAEVTTKGSLAVNVFYVIDASGAPVKSETIEAVRREIGFKILRMKDDSDLKSTSQESAKLSFGNIIRSRSERFLYNLGLIK